MAAMLNLEELQEHLTDSITVVLMHSQLLVDQLDHFLLLTVLAANTAVLAT
jgi:NTP pyrophosphatase (non-canonical NTP hydrolase)